MRYKSYHSQTPKIVLAASIVSIGLANLYVYTEMDFESNEVSVTVKEKETISTKLIETSEAAVLDEEKPQEVTFSVEYTVPGNKRNALDVKLILDNKIIISVETVHRSIDAASAGHIRIFDKGVQEQATGKATGEIEDILISKASLTTKAFKAGLRDAI
ncbi:TPA: hypothetical protein EYO12_00660 [Candidatus Saccharibacteria bacterium]|nr:hypothetical protein [Candidatus Saccharibacteria bacterium]HIO87606.1 hypothetical protein [Candidatus Saccharibacteria bacterium]